MASPFNAPEPPPLIGSSDAMAAIRAAVGHAARCGLPVLISGPGGSGKSLAAQRIVLASAGCEQPVQRLTADCGERFGRLHSGCACAIGSIPALPSARQRGGATTIVEGVDELEPEAQIRLLAAIDDSAKTTRWIAIVNGTGAKTRLPDGLRYRLAGIEIALPSLRTRIEDLPELVDYFSHAIGGGRAAVRFSARAMARLARLPFAGNVRELRNLVERAAAVSLRGSTVGEAELCALLGPGMPTARLQPAEGIVDLDRILADAERRLIRRALACSGGTVAEAARRLSVRRTTLIDRMRKHGLAVAPVQDLATIGASCSEVSAGTPSLGPG